ncbi:MAG: UDP-3-O-(3-hydroxymyristoyl)glucosamine N-acyltransferase [bacterium]|nr:UDP-3-O-(3-hydroxymyristoyl)glucosamine N-acyltransferase [bacterium]
MNRKVSEIFYDWQNHGLLTAHQGPDQTIANIAPVETCTSGDLVFVDKSAFVEAALANSPSCVVTNEKLAEKFADKNDLSVLIAPNVGLAQALMRKKYADRDIRNEGWPAIHPSAVIHETAELGEGTIVGPCAVVGANVLTGVQCMIMSGAVVEHSVQMGDRCIIHPNATIGYNGELGDEVVVHSGSVIGGEGFGLAQDSKGKSYRIPQTGNVVLEDRVEVGAGNCIDRAAFAETRIGAGTKMDNLCHIAHNVTVGEDCILVAGLQIGGSTTLGNRIIASGATGFLDHLNICDDTVFLHRAGVTKSITKAGAYAGIPFQPLGEYMKSQARTRKNGDMRQKLKDLEARLAKLEKK